MQSDYDFIIIGQGIAGSVLAYTLIEKYQKKVLVIDNSRFHSSSKVAAGIFNPITGKRMTKTWMADVVFPFMNDFYSSIEQKLSCKFLYHHKVYKPFDTITELNYWSSVSEEPEYKDYIEIILEKSFKNDSIKNPFGGLSSTKSGWLDCDNFLSSIKSYLVAKESYLERKIKFDEYNEIASKCRNELIFCEGYQATKNPLWSWLPWQPAKGEVLTISSNDLESDSIISKSVFICPSAQNNEFKLGATYAWSDFEDLSPSLEAKNELESKLKSFSNFQYEVVKQEVGIRPAVKDRKPFLGVHPENKKMAIFNGFGSKAVSLAPYFANEFSEYLVNGKESNLLTPNLIGF